MDATAPQPARNGALLRLATVVSIIVAVALIIAKLVVWRMSGSMAVLGSLVDSGMDLIASVIAFAGVRVAAEPADAQHRFGHQKAEPVAAMAQTGLITLSALFVLYESVQRFTSPQPLEYGNLALGVMVLSLVLTLALVGFQSFVLNRAESLAVDGDRAHYIGDILANIGAIVAIFLSIQFGWHHADAIAGIIAGVFLLYAAFSIYRRAVPQLMDEELSPEERSKIDQIVMADKETLGLHALRTRKAGEQIYIQLHLELDPDMTLREAHVIADRVEDELRAEFPGADVMVHQDPHGDVEPHDEYGVPSK